MKKTLTALLAVIILFLTACTAPATPTPVPVVENVNTPTPAATATFTPEPTVPATPTATLTATNTSTHTPSPPATSTPSPTPSPTGTVTFTPSATATETATPTPTATPLPAIQASCYPDESAPLEDLVILRGPEHLFDPSCQVSGGVGQITAVWDIERNGSPDLTEVDPAMSIAPGEYRPLVTFMDEAGQILEIELPRIVKVGEPDYPTWEYGVTAHVNLGGRLYENDAEIERACQIIASAGIQAVRVDFAWPNIEPNQKGKYNWNDYDRMVRILRKNGIEILALVNYSAIWASSGDTCNWYDWGYSVPKNSTDFGDYVRVLVERYRDDVKCWQIWNEPNNSMFLKSADPLKYSELLEQAFYSVKYSDPTAVVVLAGLASDASKMHPEFTWVEPAEFLQAIYSVTEGEFFDAVARHPYASPGPMGLEYIRQQVQNIRRVMTENGDQHKPLWITECGWSASGKWSEQSQSQWILEDYAYLTGLDFVGPVFWYNFRNKNTGDEFKDNLGLIQRDWNPKPVYNTLRDFIRER